MEDWRIRDAQTSDAKRIAEIYAPYVLETAISFETKPPSAEEMERRISEYKRNYPYLALEENGRVTGYAYASAYKSRAAYAPTVELSVYLDRNLLGGGRGRALTRALIERLRADARYYTAVACITVPNARSEALFASLGFRFVGGLDNAGWKLSAWHSIADYALPLRAYDAPPNP